MGEEDEERCAESASGFTTLYHKRERDALFYSLLILYYCM